MGEGLGRERSSPPFPLRFTPATQAMMRLTSFKQIVVCILHNGNKKVADIVHLFAIEIKKKKLKNRYF